MYAAHVFKDWDKSSLDVVRWNLNLYANIILIPRESNSGQVILPPELFGQWLTVQYFFTLSFTPLMSRRCLRLPLLSHYIVTLMRASWYIYNKVNGSWNIRYVDAVTHKVTLVNDACYVYNNVNGLRSMLNVQQYPKSNLPGN